MKGMLALTGEDNPRPFDRLPVSDGAEGSGAEFPRQDGDLLSADVEGVGGGD